MKKRTLFVLLALILVLQCSFVWEFLRAFNTITLFKSNILNIFYPETIRDPDTELYIVRDIFGRCGYMDKNGRIIIAPRFPDAQEFSEGLAGVSIGDKWGYIDKTGEFVIKPQFSFGGSFHDGKADIIKYDPRYDPNSSDFTYHKQGIIDKQGNTIMPPEFTYIGKVSEGMINVSNFNGSESETGFLDLNNRLVIPLTYTTATDFKNGYSFVLLGERWGVIDESGKRVTQNRFSDFRHIDNGLFMAEDSDTHLWGEINSKGDYINPVRFKDAGFFSEGLFAVQDIKSDFWGYINSSGDVVIPFQYADAKSFQNGLAAVVDERTHLLGFIDKQGKLVIGYQFLSDTFRTGLGAMNGLFLASTKYGVQKLVDRTGNTIMDNIIEPYLLDTDTGELIYTGEMGCGYSGQGLFWAEIKPGRLTFFDSHGNVKFETKGDHAGQFSEGFCQVSVRNNVNMSESCGYIDTTGRRVIDFDYSYAQDFKNGLAEIEYGDGVKSIGYINAYGKYLWMPGTAGVRTLIFAFLLMVASLALAFAAIRFSMYACNPKVDYEAMNPDTDLQLFMDKNNRYGYVDKNGSIAIRPRFADANPFHDGLAMVTIGSSCRFINRFGKYAVGNFCTPLEDFHNGYAIVCRYTGELLWGIINTQGKIVAQIEYKAIRNQSDGLYAARNEDDKWGYLDKTFQEAIPFIYAEAQDFGEGLAGVKEEANGLWGFVDKSGLLVIPYQFMDTLGFFEGLASVQDPVTGLWGFIDQSGGLVIPCSYTEAVCFQDGFAAVKAEDGKLCVIDRAGQIIRELEPGSCS